MPFETGGPDDKAVLNELNDDRLRRAVERVRENEAPEDAVSRAMNRAADLSSVAAAVRRQPAVLKPARRRLSILVVAIGLVWVVAAGAWTLTEESREAAQRPSVPNNLKQYGLAMHNYHEIDGFGKSNDRDAADLFGFQDMTLSGGTSKTFAMGDVDVGFAGESTKTASSQKKIVRKADVSLVVKLLADAEKQLGQLVQQHKGELAGSQVSQAQGQQRTARWVIRVPADAVDGLLRDLAGLGISENRTINSQDVTEEYIDLETRINSKKKLEQRILDLLEKRTGDIKDVLAVEEQSARIRAEVESMEGRKKYLDSMTAMATVNVTAREAVDYIPPEVRSFSNQVGHAWRNSFDLVKGFGKSLVLVAVALGPWIPLVSLVGFVVVRWRRRRQGRVAG
ncbi:MAG: DUF4349 domain-containing protein [Planctomycetaceae bacterium]